MYFYSVTFDNSKHATLPTYFAIFSLRNQPARTRSAVPSLKLLGRKSFKNGEDFMSNYSYRSEA